MTIKPNIKNLKEYISPFLYNKSIEKESFEKFDKSLEKYKTDIKNQHNNKQSEPNIVTNALKPFLDSIGYSTGSLSQDGQSGVDLVIFKESNPVILIEAKKQGSKDLITKTDLNKKSFHELVLYFMRERTKGNNSIFYLIITDFYQWYIFDAKDFDNHFWNNTQIKKIFTDLESPSVLGDRTKDFYETLANVEWEKDLNCCYFDIQNLEDLKALYKVFSKDFLLKEFNPNDANSLNRDFYNELLYILGLEESKKGGKKLINRAKDPQNGTLFENIQNKLSQRGKVSEFERVLSLLLIWINRILFLKLLESQIYNYNFKNRDLKFLNREKIKDFDDLERLFFETLAKPIDARSHKEFDYIPYLNSSLFEFSDIEDRYLSISSLENNMEISYCPKTLLKDAKQKRKTGKVNTLHYLFDFLDAYDFGLESSGELISENRPLINASVLGLIFEKLNGYKDGSFYTPSFITMYMAKESLEKAVIDKFNTLKSWGCKNLLDIYNKIEDTKEANKIVNSITVCDPAVGSGHFLVSCLNEILRIKSELGILSDESGKRLKDTRISIENDEIFIITNGDFHTYAKPKDLGSETQRVQKTIFSEKQRIIENQLFGVDINPNSVNITRLRLWIELLKHTFYKLDGSLETLPNIDINIKCGNSLISRFDLKDELKIKNIKEEIKIYKEKVNSYKNNLGTKKEILESIKALKEKFRLTLKLEWKVAKDLNDKLKEFVADFGYEDLNNDLLLEAIHKGYKQHATFDFADKDLKKKAKLQEELAKLQKAKDEIEQGKIYEDAFEWRFEFPEVLDEDGNFVGFDVVIGNPPYIDYRLINKDTVKILKDFCTNFQSPRPNIYQYFIEQAYNILTKNGICCFINPNQFLSIDGGYGIRKLIVENTIINFIDDVSNLNIFEEASTYTVVWSFRKEKNGNYPIRIGKCNNESELGKNTLTIRKNEIIQNGKYLIIGNLNQWLILKIEKEKEKLINLCNMFWGTSKSGYGKLKIKKEGLEKLTIEQRENYKPILQTRDIKRYAIDWQGEFISKDLYSSNVLEKFKEKDKILVARMTLSLQASIDFDNCFIGKSTIIHNISKDISKEYLLAILNSKLIDFWYKNYFENTHLSGGYIRFDIPYLQKIPIALISIESQQYFIDLVNQILASKKENPNCNTKDLEYQIDTMVYELYGLNDEEIKIIEGRK